jgi:hypothetical protein
MRCKATLLLAIWAAFPVTAFAQTEPQYDPLPGTIPASDYVVEVKDFATIPYESHEYPLVNQLTTSPDGRIFVTSQHGYVYQVSDDGTSVTPYLDLWQEFLLKVGTPDVLHLVVPFGIADPELGFESIAFHPDFMKPGTEGYGRFYTVVTVAKANPGEEVRAADYATGSGDHAYDNVLLEWRTATPDASTFVPADPAAPYRELLRVEGPFRNHTMGLVAFNPNAWPGSADYGKLYLGLGDGGSIGDPLHLAQNKSKPYGKILRIDPLGNNSANGRYGIPADNPFIGVHDVLPEIWALGLRNPQRFVWDRGGTGRMFIADIGQGMVEELDLGLPGANYGWGEREGSFVYVNVNPEAHPYVGAKARDDAATSGYTYPIAEYDHGEGLSITAGVVARGTDAPDLEGKLIFGDIAWGVVFAIDAENAGGGGSGAIRTVRLSFDGIENTLLRKLRSEGNDSERVDLRFGTDQTGRIFLLNKQDGIIRVVSSSRVLATPTPSPTATPTPARGPAPDEERPEPPSIGGKTKLVVARPRVRLQGQTDAGTYVEYKVTGEGGFRRIRGRSRWSLNLSVGKGRTVVQFRTVDKASHLKSAITKVFIVRH